uniref:Zinc finger protein 708-like n=1 Tax=Diabrotica virgifera virgifera TaxID=50390 RepID=A0A6P7GTW4_DIAVI
MAKPYMHDVVQIKVAPASEKCISIVQEDEEVEKNEIVTTTTMGGETKINNAVAETEEAVHDRLVEEFPEGTIVEIENETVETVETSCFPCNECDRSFPLQQLLDLHMEKHTKERNFECEVCLNKFYTIYDLQKHSLIHNPDKGFECGVCNKSFNRVSFLRKHEKIHKDVEWHTCPKCDKSFMSKENLNFHMHDHNKSRPFGCKICNKSFVFKQGLERHEVIHSNNKPHKCNYCDASFISAIKLTRHITSHAGLRPYPCKICGRTFLLSHHLTRHMRSHYSSNPTETIIGQYKCDICSMAFRRKDSLINHSAIHSMVNLKCVICNTTFETVDLVKEHITTHLASLPFPCDKCDYSFETEEQLEEHELRHAEMEYEEQIEKEVFSESIMQITRPHSEEEDEAMEEDEGTEINALTRLMTPSLADPNPKPTAALQDIATPDTSTHSLGNKTVKMGDKLVKVQKFILTTDEMKAMAKQGIIELRGGQVVLRSKGQQVLNASIKSIDKNEIDSLLDKRNKIQLKKYDKKVVSSDVIVRTMLVKRNCLD